MTQIETDKSGAVTAVVYVQDGREHRQPCRNVFLCGGAVETPRLLLMNALANSSGQVGRNFMAHTAIQLWGQFEGDIRPYKGIPGGLISEDTHRPKDADFAGGYLLQSIGVMPVTYASQFARAEGVWGQKMRDHMRGYNHVAGINICGDCLPYEHNYLELSAETDARGLPKPRVPLHGRREREADDRARREDHAGLVGRGRRERSVGIRSATPIPSAPAAWATIPLRRSWTPIAVPTMSPACTS